MKKSTFILTMLLGCMSVATGWADVPFKTTSLTADGEFADTTTWYTIKIGSGGLVISDNDGAANISLTVNSTQYADADLWCVVGDDTNGYRLYNKQAGAGKVLASPATMSGTTGGSAYVIMKDTAELGTDYVADWLFAASDDLGDDVDGVYMYQLGAEDNKVNNRDNKLAFWTGGADAGSTLEFSFGGGAFDISPSTGSGLSTSSFGSTWTSTSTKPLVTFYSSYNNNKIINGYITLYVGSRTSPLTIATSTNDTILGYSFDFCNYDATDVTLTAGGVTYTAKSTDQHVEVTGLNDVSTSFSIAGSNKGIYIKNFKVYLKLSSLEPEEQFNLFEYGSTGNTICYRIPGIAKAYNGDLIAVTDYRHSGADIGMVTNGRIDLRYRISTDNGKTWGDIQTLVEGQGSSSPDFMHVAFGDPCIVADRGSSRVLVMSCGGNVSYPNGTRTNHQNIARFYSEDNGATWSEPVDIAESIYSQFDDSKIGSASAMFVGSGRIFQSSTVKVDQYYRIYCAVLFRDVNSVEKNYVLYSDDFGGNWSVLGGVDVAPIPSGANEPKVEELPDGSIVVSSRCTGGRYYNIFNFTDSEAATGSWGTMSFSGASNDGVEALSNSCNGEIMVVPARRVSDGKGVYLALQSVPFGSGRANVGIYYKELASLSDFDTPANFAANWDGRHQASSMGSAYSTMTLQADSTIGFVYEESTFGYDYTIVYKSYSIDYITDSAYVYDPTVVADSIVAEGIASKYETVKGYFGTNVGNIAKTGEADVTAAYNAYVAAPSKSKYEALTASIVDADRIEIEEGKLYRIRNSNRSDGTLYLRIIGSSMGVSTLDESSKNQLFTFFSAGDGEWYIYNEGASRYISRTPAVYNTITVNTSATYDYTVSSSYDGLSALICNNPSNSSYPAIHLDGSSKLVPWTATSEASLWYIEPTELTTAIEQLETETVDGENGAEVFYDMSGRQVSKPEKGVYMTNKRRKVYVK
ncbi:MAG: sialidase family protein [Bacteroidales bacterium]|nr:sialidase family protein [Bacteroidales bacterium]